jgi:hypothetical protein
MDITGQLGGGMSMRRRHGIVASDIMDPNSIERPILFDSGAASSSGGLFMNNGIMSLLPSTTSTAGGFAYGMMPPSHHNITTTGTVTNTPAIMNIGQSDGWYGINTISNSGYTTSTSAAATSAASNNFVSSTIEDDIVAKVIAETMAEMSNVVGGGVGSGDGNSSSGILDGDDVGGGSGDDGSQTWACHLHQKDSCFMKRTKNKIYHVIPIPSVTMAAQKYNEDTKSANYTELCDVMPVTAVAYLSSISNISTFKAIYDILLHLDMNRMRYTEHNKPSDFVKRHIVSDGNNKLILCNKYLIKTIDPTKSYKVKYTRLAYIKLLLKAMFPKICASKKTGVATNIPGWALKIYMLPSNQKLKSTITSLR